MNAHLSRWYVCGLLAVSLPLSASPTYPVSSTGQLALAIERGFSKLSQAASNYAFDQCAFPTAISQISPSYAFLPITAGFGSWSVGVNGDGSQGYVCYHAATDISLAVKARDSVKNAHLGLVVAPSCGAHSHASVDSGVEILTWWLASMVFPDDCIAGT